MAMVGAVGIEGERLCTHAVGVGGRGVTASGRDTVKCRAPSSRMEGAMSRTRLGYFAMAAEACTQNQASRC